MVTGGIKTAQYASKIVEEGLTDLVGVGRALLKDKFWAEKAVKELQESEQ